MEDIDYNLNTPIGIAGLQVTSYHYRGQILGDTIYLERLLDSVIASHFCPEIDKQKEFYELIIANERMSFSNKIQVFEYLFKKYHKDFVEKHPTIFADIKNINDERNMVAHFLLDSSPEGIERFNKEGVFGFVKFRNGKETIWRNNTTDYVKFHKLHLKYIEAIQGFLITLLPSENTPVDKNNLSEEKLL